MKFLVAFILFAVFACGPVQTDGVLSTGEWSGADEYDLGDGNKVLLKSDKNVLYVALKGGQLFWSHMYLSDGRRVRVMHASAALGAIEYKMRDSLWQTSNKSFKYDLRESEFNAVNMDGYYSKNAWVANNNNTGDKRTIEVKINLDGFEPCYFACVMATEDKFYSFPVGLVDNTVLTKLVQGYAVDSLKFQPKTWMEL